MQILLNRDFYEVLPKIAPIDFVLTDPPYDFMSGGTGGAFGDRPFKKEILKSHGSTKSLDEQVDFTPFFNKKLYNKGINGAIFCTQKSLGTLITLAEKGDLVYQILIWHKTNPIPYVNNTYLSDIEFIFVFREKNIVPMYGEFHTLSRVYQSTTNTKDKKLYGHPTIKPMPLIEKLIMNHTKEGDVILDPFLGSGTTAVCAEKMGRGCIGIEKDEEYFKIAEQRIEDARQQQPLLT